MDENYAWEKLYTAVLILASSSGSVQIRLRNAYVPHLMNLRSQHHFPWPDLRQRFEDLMEELAPNGQIDVALANWPDEDVKRIIEGLVGLYDLVARRLGE